MMSEVSVQVRRLVDEDFEEMFGKGNVGVTHGE
jgi:hypothetical protein